MSGATFELTQEEKDYLYFARTRVQEFPNGSFRVLGSAVGCFHNHGTARTAIKCAREWFVGPMDVITLDGVTRIDVVPVAEEGE